MEPFLGEIRAFSFGFAPRGWANCDGQILSIQQNQALFSILGITYGGNGQTTFALPDLRGRAPLDFSPTYPLGQAGGEAQHILQISEVPSHSHTPVAFNGPATTASPSGAAWATPQGFTAYGGGATTDATMATGALNAAGASHGHPNMQPYLALNYCIALEGIYPSRN